MSRQDDNQVLLKELMNEVDADHDGFISADEFSGALSSVLRKSLKRVNGN